MLAKLPQKSDVNLLVGYETSDDAGVYRLDDERALVVTADVITPPVDDPFLFGQIGAANSLSDVYAMGGTPLTCINMVGFPANELGPEVLHGIVEGALSKITEAGAVLAGGHTTDDEEPKFGLSVTGMVHPQRVWRNSGVREGNLLILTKPIGSGVLFNANLKNWVSQQALASCLETITALNRRAAETATRFEIQGATDITGFGLAGHALEMAQGSNLTLKLQTKAIPVMDEALAMYEKGMSTGVNAANRELIADRVRFNASLAFAETEILVDPQTSGGLLLAVSEEQAEELVAALKNEGVSAAVIIGQAIAEQEEALIFA